MSPHIPTLQNLTAQLLGVDPETIQPDADLGNEHDLDSLDHVELLMEIESAYGITLNDEQCEDFRTLNDFAAHLDGLGLSGPLPTEN
jgi:acyl carrier protein